MMLRQVSSPASTDSTVLTLPLTPVATVQGTLALDLGPHLDVPEPEVAGRPGDSALLDVVHVDLVQRRRFEQHAARVGAAVVEIVGGDRPVSQLLRWTTPEVYQDLSRRALLVARAVGPSAGQRRHPVGPSAAGRRPHELRLRALRRGQPARALRRPLPRGRRPLRASRWQVWRWSLLSSSREDERLPLRQVEQRAPEPASPVT